MILFHYSIHYYIYRHRAFLTMAVCLCLLCSSLSTMAQNKKAKNEKVYLDHADELRYDQYVKMDVQIVKGNVQFRYGDTRLWCDSAYFNQNRNTFHAFGHVRMKKSKGITLTCSRAFYDGDADYVQAREKVVVTQPGSSLHCDSLDYNVATEYANFFGGNGGKLQKGNTIVTSREGEYYFNAHDANFYGDVVMKSPKYTINTDNLRYNTDTEVAHVTGESVVYGRNGEVVHTNDGYYYSKTDRMELNGRSTITSKERDVEGDYINYNSTTGESEGRGNAVYHDKIGDRVITGDSLSYNDKTKIGEGRGHVVYTDRKNRNSLIADYVHYTESSAIAHGNPLVKDFSQKDTLFMHSDTIRMEAFHVNTDSVYRKVHCYKNVRMFRTDIQAVCDSLVGYSRDSCVVLYKDPIAWNGARQILCDSIKIFLNDSTVREAFVYGHALAIEQMNDREHYNQISSSSMRAHFKDGKLRLNEAIGNVLSIYYSVDEKDSTILFLDDMKSDTLRMYLSEERKMEKIWVSKPDGVLYPLTQVPPGKDKLPGFAWFDYVRPLDKNDLFRRVGKGDNVKLKSEKAVFLPRQIISTKPEGHRNVK